MAWMQSMIFGKPRIITFPPPALLSQASAPFTSPNIFMAILRQASLTVRGVKHLLKSMGAGLCFNYQSCTIRSRTQLRGICAYYALTRRPAPQMYHQRKSNTVEETHLALPAFQINTGQAAFAKDLN